MDVRFTDTDTVVYLDIFVYVKNVKWHPVSPSFRYLYLRKLHGDAPFVP